MRPPRFGLHRGIVETNVMRESNLNFGNPSLFTILGPLLLQLQQFFIDMENEGNFQSMVFELIFSNYTCTSVGTRHLGTDRQTGRVNIFCTFPFLLHSKFSQSNITNTQILSDPFGWDVGIWQALYFWWHWRWSPVFIAQTLYFVVLLEECHGCTCPRVCPTP